MVDLTDVGRKARAASVLMGILDSNAKNDILFAMADALEKNAEAIIYANSRDMEKARAAGRPDSILDRLLLDENSCRAARPCRGSDRGQQAAQWIKYYEKESAARRNRNHI